MSRFLSILLLLPLACLSAQVGCFVRITVQEVVPTAPPDSDTGIVPFGPGRTLYYFYYYPGVVKSDSSVYSSLFMTRGHDIFDGTAPSNPNYEYRNWYLVGGLKQYPLDTDYANTNGMSALDRPHFESPIYNSTAGIPFLTNTSNYYTGNNSQFPYDSVDVLSGNIQPSGRLPQYIYYDSNGDVHTSESSTPVDGDYEWRYVDGVGWGLFPATSSGDVPSGSTDLTPLVSAVESQGSLTRAELVRLLGASGNSWVYDCSLSLSQLYALASSQGLITRPQIDLSAIESSLNTIAAKQYPTVDVSGLATESTLKNINTRLGNWNSYILGMYNNQNSYIRPQLLSIKNNTDSMSGDLSAIKDILNGWDSSVAPSLSSPDFGTDSPDDDLPFDVGNFTSDFGQSFGQLTSWGNNGVPSALDFSLVNGLLTRIVGQIPSVGTDSRMFSFDLTLPYIGRIEKEWSFSDIPFISEFRSFCLWLLYVAFGLASYKTLHSTII